MEKKGFGVGSGETEYKERRGCAQSVETGCVILFNFDRARKPSNPREQSVRSPE